MAEKAKDSEISLESYKTETSTVYTLKIPNFFILPEYDSTRFNIVSPVFEFASSNWCFRFTSIRQLVNEKNKHFNLFLERLNFGFKKTIFYTATLLDCNDKEYDMWSSRKFDGDLHRLGENKAKYHISVFNNNSPHWDRRDTLTVIFEMSFIKHGEPRTLQRAFAADREVIELFSRTVENPPIELESFDTTLDVKEKEFEMLKKILAAESSTSVTMYKHDISKDISNIVNTSNGDLDSFTEFLELLNCGKLKLKNVSSGDGFYLYKIADMYGKQELKKFSVECMKDNLTVKNICSIILLAEEYNEADLLTAAEIFLNRYPRATCFTDEFIDLFHNNIQLCKKLMRKFH